MANLAIEHGISNKDFTVVWKVHNLKSGIHKRVGEFSSALEEIRACYEFSHRPEALIDNVSHVVPIKNRAALEFLYGDNKAFTRLLDELKNHPDVQNAMPELEKEIGNIKF